MKAQVKRREAVAESVYKRELNTTQQALKIAESVDKPHANRHPGRAIAGFGFVPAGPANAAGASGRPAGFWPDL